MGTFIVPEDQITLSTTFSPFFTHTENLLAHSASTLSTTSTFCLYLLYQKSHGMEKAEKNQFEPSGYQRRTTTTFTCCAFPMSDAL